MTAGGGRPLGEERPEALRRALDDAELRVEAIDERARGGSDGEGREIGREGARDRDARRLCRFAIAFDAAGRYRLIGDQESEGVSQRLRGCRRDGDQERGRGKRGGTKMSRHYFSFLTWICVALMLELGCVVP